MRITYAQGGGTLAPSLIEYTQTSASGSAYPYAVSLTYGTRDPNDRTTGFIAGAQFTVGSQLLRIDVSRSGSLARRYNLSYVDSATTQRARLSAVQECSGSNGTDCLSPTQMTYQEGAVGVADLTVNAGEIRDQADDLRFVDLNGDARPDALYSFTSAGGGDTATWYVSFANPNGGYEPPIYLGIAGTPSNNAVLVDDFIGDGRLALLEGTTGTWRLHRWNGSAFTDESTGTAVGSGVIWASRHTAASADINGDGKADLVYAANSAGVASLYTRLNTSSGGVPSFSSTATAAYPISLSPSSGLYFGGVFGNYAKGLSSTRRQDFNGDGREDVVLRQSGSAPTSVLISQGTVFATGFPVQGVLEPAAMNFNNDACTDVVTENVHISPCNGSAG